MNETGRDELIRNFSIPGVLVAVTSGVACKRASRSLRADEKEKRREEQKREQTQGKGKKQKIEAGSFSTLNFQKRENSDYA
jgi:hypothetical protein